MIPEEPCRRRDDLGEVGPLGTTETKNTASNQPEVSDVLKLQNTRCRHEQTLYNTNLCRREAENTQGGEAKLHSLPVNSQNSHCSQPHELATTEKGLILTSSWCISKPIYKFNSAKCSGVPRDITRGDWWGWETSLKKVFPSERNWYLSHPSMKVSLGPERRTTQNSVPNGVHPILLKHSKELRGLKCHWQERGMSLFPMLALGFSQEVQPLDQAGLKRDSTESKSSCWEGLHPSLCWAFGD